MAKKQSPNQNNINSSGQSFSKGLQQDMAKVYNNGENIFRTRNAITNSSTGDYASIGNEPANELCTQAPYTIIGSIHIKGSYRAIFSTDDVNSEIGLFNEELCKYHTIVNDPCLKFDRLHLISGRSKEGNNCYWQVYFADAKNPDRKITIDVDNPDNNKPFNPDGSTNINTPIPWLQNCVDSNGPSPGGCYICDNTNQLNCDAIRLESLMIPPCATLSLGSTSGTILNGSYFGVIAYTIDGQKVTDYFTPTNVQPVFNHDNAGGSLIFTIENMDKDFDEFQLVLISFYNGQTSARIVGNYSTRQEKITLDYIDERWVAIDINDITIRNTIAEKSDSIFSVGNYLLRVGPTDKLNFNYQPLANQIVAKWVSVEYPQEYYRKGGNKTNYLRDEVYTFFIRWIYNTGDKSVSYHIPGRPAYPSDIQTTSSDILTDEPALGLDKVWVSKNTAIVTSTAVTTLPDGGQQIAEGYMSYWESSEFYDDDKPEVWNASFESWNNVTNIPYPGTANSVNDYDLCGKPIRHHKFPDNNTDISASARTNHYKPGGGAIRLMGVKFENIKAPLDNNGNVISNIVGYEILRGSRKGNESIIAKGIINNMFEYNINGDPNSNSGSINLISSKKGLFPNYPYNDLRPDPYISTTETQTIGGNVNANPLSTYSKNDFTFHSPDTSFYDPFLSAKEFKVYGEFKGEPTGAFTYPKNHPKHVMVTEVAFIVSLAVGIGYAMAKMLPKKTKKLGLPFTSHTNTIIGTAGTDVSPSAAGFGLGSILLNSLAEVGVENALNLLRITDAINGLNIVGTTMNVTATAINAYAAAAPGMTQTPKTWEFEDTPYSTLPLPIRAIVSPVTFLSYAAEGGDTMMRLIKAFSKPRQYALQYISHCHYNDYSKTSLTNKRYEISESRYIDPYIQDFTSTKRINNLHRTRIVALETKQQINNTVITDTSKQTLKSSNFLPTSEKYKNPTKPFKTTAASHYGALKQRVINQYGQLNGIIQIPTGSCPQYVNVTSSNNFKSDIIFGGDTYVGRFTQKNTMPFFYEWLNGQPDESEFNYKLYQMFPYIRYWMDTSDFDFGEFVNSIGSSIGASGSFFNNLSTAQDKHAFDRNGTNDTGWITLRNTFMYLYNSGVFDFFVESSVNVDLRDWNIPVQERHYDPYGYTNINEMFEPDYIKSGNYYKYDFSLSINKLFTNYISFGNVNANDYSPYIQSNCYVHRPKRVIYSLPQQLESKRDNWQIFLSLNYKDFLSRVTTVKNINQTGALFLFENESPVMLSGTEQLDVAGTKITLGDGELFRAVPQNMNNAEKDYEYGSCQNRLAAVNTPAGIFYMSQNQGKIFQVQEGIQEIGIPGSIKWWLLNYLPYNLTKDFPDYDLKDNPIMGIGCQATYDNDNAIIYFTKKDYKLIDGIKETIVYVGNGKFRVNNMFNTDVNDTRFFEKASWTLSFDPKNNSFVGWHDWHPDLIIPTKTTFLTTKGNGIWRHNKNCQLFCNYYGIDYPFEVEFILSTQINTTTLKNLEYQLEAYKYSDNCYDRFHVLDENFDEAIIYNTEQCSGLLKLLVTPKNNPFASVTYPQVSGNTILTLYSKEENKYRINQFYDITKDRGEFSNADEVIFDTEANGYIRNLNNTNLDYNKIQTEHKPFRHYLNKIFLRKTVSKNIKLLLNIVNIKSLNSPR